MRAISIMAAPTNELVTGKVMPSYDSLPYRPCVGVMVLNRLVPAGARLRRMEVAEACYQIWNSGGFVIQSVERTGSPELMPLPGG